MTPPGIAAALAVAVSLTACSGPGGATKPVPKAATSPALTAWLGNLCERMQKSACEPDVGKVSPEDRATLVITGLGEQNPEFERFVTEQVSTAKPAERKQRFIAGVSQAIGKPWACPVFDALWENRLVNCDLN